MSTHKPSASATDEKVTVVKKYANRRLYNTGTSSYVTLDELAQMVRRGENFVVFDAKTGEEITRSVLTQIILEEDAKGRNLLPIGFLRKLIGFYDDSLHAFLPRYLEASMEHFIQNQEQMRRYFEGTVGRLFPMGQHFEDMTRQNVALFQQAANMFTPFPQPGRNGDEPEGERGNEERGSREADKGEAAKPVDNPGHGAKPAGGASREDVDALRAQLETLKSQLDRLAQSREAGGDESGSDETQTPRKKKKGGQG